MGGVLESVCVCVCVCVNVSARESRRVRGKGVLESSHCVCVCVGGGSGLTSYTTGEGLVCDHGGRWGLFVGVGFTLEECTWMPHPNMWETW